MPELSPADIKAARERAGLTQVQLAAKIGCSPITVSYWERGTRKPTGLYAAKLHVVLRKAGALATS